MIREKFFYNDSIDNKIDLMEYVTTMYEIWEKIYYDFFIKIIDSKGYVDYFKVASKMTKPLLDRLSETMNLIKNHEAHKYFDVYNKSDLHYNIGDKSDLTFVDVGIEPSHVRISSPHPADIFPDINIVQFPFFSNIVYNLLNKYNNIDIKNTVGDEIVIPYLTMIPSKYHILTANNNVNPDSKFELLKTDPPILEIGIFSIYKSIYRLLKYVGSNSILTQSFHDECVKEAKIYATYTVLVILLNLRNSYNIIANSIVSMFNAFYMKRTSIAQTTNDSRYIYECLNRLMMKPESQHIWNIFLSKYSTTTYNLFIDDIKTKNFIIAIKESYNSGIKNLFDIVERDKQYLQDSFLNELKEEIMAYGEICDDVINSIFDFLYILKVTFLRHKNDRLYDYSNDPVIVRHKNVLINKLKFIRLSTINSITILKQNGYPEYDSVIVSKIFSVFTEKLVDLIEDLILSDINYGDKTEIFNNINTYLSQEDLKEFENDIIENGFSNALIKRLNNMASSDVVTESLVAALTADLFKNKAIEVSQNNFIDKYKNERFIYDMNDIIMRASENLNRYKY